MKAIVKAIGQVTTLTLVSEAVNDLAGFNHLAGNEKNFSVSITTDSDTVRLKPSGKANKGPKSLKHVVKVELVLTPNETAVSSDDAAEDKE